jgi:prefoldin subunit 5
MAKKNKLKSAAVRIGSAIGRAESAAHKIRKASAVAGKELDDLTAQIDALKRQLQKTTRRLKKALA